MRISHEVPFCILEQSIKFNDIDFALVHLFEEYPEYYQFFVRSLRQGREVILDNSVFELGYPFDEEIYKEWILKLRPTYTIIPDKFENTKFTIESVLNWSMFLRANGLKSIGVIQGTSLNEFKECYKAISPFVDKVAISFAQPLFERLYPLENKDFARMYGRLFLINYLYSEGALDTNKPHHLLGCSLPQEMKFYKNAGYSFIDSVDTSSPIVHGLKGIRYTKDGLKEKYPIKLVDLFDTSRDQVLSEDISLQHNINMFKSFLS